MELQTIIYILCAIIVIQIIEIAGLVYLYIRKKALLEEKEKHVSKAYYHTIDSANKKAEEIIQNAVDKAESIIYESHAFKKKVDKEMTFAFNDALKKHENELEKGFDEAFDIYKKSFQDAVTVFGDQSKATQSQIQVFAENELNLLKTEISKKTSVLDGYLKEKVDAEFEAAKMEIAQFKESEMKRASAGIQESISKIITDVLHLSIPRDQQEKLIMDALEKAKKEKLFSL